MASNGRLGDQTWISNWQEQKWMWLSFICVANVKDSSVSTFRRDLGDHIYGRWPCFWLFSEVIFHPSWPTENYHHMWKAWRHLSTVFTVQHDPQCCQLYDVTMGEVLVKEVSGRHVSSDPCGPELQYYVCKLHHHVRRVLHIKSFFPFRNKWWSVEKCLYHPVRCLTQSAPRHAIDLTNCACGMLFPIIDKPSPSHLLKPLYIEYKFPI